MRSVLAISALRARFSLHMPLLFAHHINNLVVHTGSALLVRLSIILACVCVCVLEYSQRRHANPRHAPTSQGLICCPVKSITPYALYIYYEFVHEVHNKEKMKNKRRE